MHHLSTEEMTRMGMYNLGGVKKVASVAPKCPVFSCTGLARPPGAPVSCTKVCTGEAQQAKAHRVLWQNNCLSHMCMYMPPPFLRAHARICIHVLVMHLHVPASGWHTDAHMETFTPAV